jgi:hypothetical protein
MTKQEYAYDRKIVSKFPTDKELLDNGNTLHYKINNGTYYSANYPDELVDTLEYHRQRQTRLRFYYGDLETGEDWEEHYDTQGRIGRSTGGKPIPILLYNSRSIGGVALFSSIVKLETSKDKQLLWKHPKYHKKVDSK